MGKKRRVTIETIIKLEDEGKDPVRLESRASLINDLENQSTVIEDAEAFNKALKLTFEALCDLLAYRRVYLVSAAGHQYSHVEWMSNVTGPVAIPLMVNDAHDWTFRLHLRKSDAISEFLKQLAVTPTAAPGPEK